MAPAIGMQMILVLLGLSSGLQLGQHRYARKVNQLAGMGAGGETVFWVIGLEPHLTSNVSGTNQSTFKHKQLTYRCKTEQKTCYTSGQTKGQLIKNTLGEYSEMILFYL